MPCYHPQTGYRTRSGRNENGLWPVTFNIQEGYHDLQVIVPCGRCIGCRLEKSRQWAIRITHEATLHKENCFITLTYNNENLPNDKSIDVKHFQKFMKKLRKKYNKQTIRFFHCGEYGQTCKTCQLSQPKCQCKKFIKSLGRPHYHAILFGINFTDKVLFQQREKGNWYTSNILDKLWKKGYCTIGEVTFESAAYVARYVTKKITGPDKKDWYKEKKPEYITMSRRPGIAKNWYLKYKEDVYSGDKIITRDGKSLTPPRYYDRMYAIDNPKDFEKIQIKRRKRVEQQDPDERWYRRRETKEKHKQLQTQQLTRQLEEN